MQLLHCFAPFKHSLASPSTVAEIMTRKYVDGLPLARQEKIFKREGIELSRATMANWIIQCAQTWLRPVYRRMKKHLLASDVIYADETVVQVLKEDGKPATSESRMWVYGSDGRSGVPIRYFEYQPDRSGKLAEAVTYAQNQKHYLSAFLEHGEVEISNNFAENAIRPFVMGRKNWLFCDTPKGAESSAIVYTMVETAKANGWEPYDYLMHVLSLMPYVGKNPTPEELDGFMPWNPALREAALEI